jgi:2-polyprenyl-3-methyl-5-hydroxy-6-metoxy-1,4-benzoquinol methylase
MTTRNVDQADVASDGSWTSSDLETLRRCVVCGSDRLTTLYADLDAHEAGGWRLVRCRGCGVGLLNPRPTVEAIGKAYQGDYLPYRRRVLRPRPGRGRERLRRAIEDAYLARRYGYRQLPSSRALAGAAIALPPLRRAADRLVRYVPAPPAHGRLLDIGCASGGYLEMMRELGWESRGVELDPGAVRSARELDLDVRQGAMTDVDPDVDGLFDHVTVGHVLEHTHDPVEALRAARRVLRPNGTIWIGTPNLASLGARAFGSRWRALEPPRHLVLFTPRSLAMALRTAGFVDIEPVRARASAVWHFEQSARLAGIARHRPVRAAARMVNALTYFLPKLSDEMSVLAKRAG